MRKREVIELRHRINCVGWPCASAVINKERSLTARPGKHAGVQEHGTPDIVMFVIPGTRILRITAAAGTELADAYS